MDHSSLAALDAAYEPNADLSLLSSMKIGGKCDILIRPRRECDLVNAVNICRRENIPYFITGRGSNVIFGDFNGAIISTRDLTGFSVEENKITAAAGEALFAVCNAALENSLSGMEPLYGIPGSVGGALFMNAGAFGGEMKDIVQSARALMPDGSIKEFLPDEMELSYRHSVFQHNGACILSVTIMLEKGEKGQILARMEELMQRRRDKQPLEFPSCGSTFKRPENGFAAALIEECGLKGCAVGGAQVSEKHSGFVINKGGATLDDVLALIEHIKKTVLEQKGVALECEMIVVDKAGNL